MKRPFATDVLLGLAISGLLATSAPAAVAQANQGQQLGKPVIEKKGTLNLDIVETTPFVFKGRVYRLEWFRSGSCLRIMDRATGDEVSFFGTNHQFACAYAEGNKVYVVGSRNTKDWNRASLTMFTSETLTNWSEHTIFTSTNFGVCNTSLCKAGDRYVMSIEVTRPDGFPARFLESKDLVTWTQAPDECRHQLGRYNAAHCLRWHEGWFYLFYLEADKPHGYEQYVTRSRDLIHWTPSPLNPVLAASAEDKLPANPRLTPANRERIAKAANVNNSDIDFCEYNGGLIINYSWGNQQGIEFLAEAAYAGTTIDFLKAWFPNQP